MKWLCWLALKIKKYDVLRIRGHDTADILLIRYVRMGLMALKRKLESLQFISLYLFNKVVKV